MVGRMGVREPGGGWGDACEEALSVDRGRLDGSAQRDKDEESGQILEKCSKYSHYILGHPGVWGGGKGKDQG